MLRSAGVRSLLMSMQGSLASQGSKMALLGAWRGAFLQQAVVLLCRSSSALLALWPGPSRHLLLCPAEDQPLHCKGVDCAVSI